MSLNAFKAAVGSIALISLGAGVANAAVSAPARTAAWRPELTGVAGTTTAVTGVRASGTTTEFAFVTNYFTHQMYVKTNNKAWTRKNDPGMAKGEMVVEAKALAANHLVAFTVLPNRSSRVLSYYQGKWKVIHKFGAPIGSATVLSVRNIWVFGAVSSKTLGVWHYDGKSWKRVAASGAAGSGVTATSAWAVRGTVAEHFANGRWTGTNLASLIPQGRFGVKSLVGVYATPGSPVYAVGSGNHEDIGGPIVVLRFDGRHWSRAASYPRGSFLPTGISPDGRGGLVISGTAGASSPAEVLHYAKGSHILVAESAPGMTNVRNSLFFTAANVPGTTKVIIGGAATAKSGTANIATIYTNS